MPSQAASASAAREKTLTGRGETQLKSLFLLLRPDKRLIIVEVEEVAWRHLHRFKQQNLEIMQIRSQLLPAAGVPRDFS